MGSETVAHKPPNLEAIRSICKYDLKTAIMERDDCGPEEAEEILQEWRDEVAEGADPETVLFENGLEPDYVFDLI